MKTQTTKIFKSGNSLAVRLPKDFRLEGKTVSISHVGRGLLLQPMGGTWKDICNELHGLSEEDFSMMLNVEDLPVQEREILQ